MSVTLYNSALMYCEINTYILFSHRVIGRWNSLDQETVNAPKLSQKNVLTLKRYSSKLQGAILMKFVRNIQNTLE